MNEFYVYILLRPWNGVPCYIGKGTRGRCFVHQKMGEKHPNLRLRRIIAKASEPLPVVKVAEGLTEDQAFILEKALIKQYGRKTLANSTDGGEGFTGGRHTAESKARIGKAHSILKLGHEVSEETRKKIGDANRGRVRSDEQKEKISQSIKESEKAKAHIKQLADDMRGKHLSDEHKEKLRQANLGSRRSPEARAAMSEAQRRRVHGPISDEVYAKRQEYWATHSRSEESKERTRQAIKLHWEKRRAKARAA